jgi:hypothetical protein
MSGIAVSRYNLKAVVIAITISACAGILALVTAGPGVALATVCAALGFAFLLISPPFWLAIALIALIPFHGLITALLDGYGSNLRQGFAIWKEVLLAVGTIRAVLNNPERKTIVASNAWVLLCAGLMFLVYFVAFLVNPSIAGIFSIDLETRFLGVMVFLLFLDLGQHRIAVLIRLMLWSIGLIALYGLVQYKWDYERLMSLVPHIPELFADGHRRIYSYSLNPLDPGYGSMIAMLLLFSGAGRLSPRAAAPWFLLLVPCFMLAYTRSAYVGLSFGVVGVCIADRGRYRRHLAIVSSAVVLLSATLLFAGTSVLDSDLGQRVSSILSQNDESSYVHKESMTRAIDLISRNPFGIGLGKSGIVEMRFAGVVDQAESTENWVLQVAVQAGIPGALAYLAVTSAVVLSLFSRRGEGNGDSRTLGACALGVFLAMTVAGVMIPVWISDIPAVYAWALVGMALRCSSGVSRAQRSEPPGNLDRGMVLI